MRFADLLQLALSALGQQKVRTLLTTMGVLFGSFVLASSLSVGQGVQDTITRESRKHDRLRRVEVWPTWGVREETIPAEVLNVLGAMSEDRRKRIRQALVQRWSREHAAGPITPLDGKRLRELAALNHVERVVPRVDLNGGTVVFNGQAVSGTATAAQLGDERFRRRIVAGEFFTTADERAVVVSEFLLYRCGLRNEADVGRAVGQTLRLEISEPNNTPGLVVIAIHRDGSQSKPDEARLLSKLASKLPEALGRIDLTERERDAVRRLVDPGEPPAPAPPVTAEFVIKGVFRLPKFEDMLEDFDAVTIDADVVLPQGTAEELALRSAPGDNFSFNEATMIVDREENVLGVMAQTKLSGLRCHAPIEFIQRERFQYLLIFYSMATIAGVALLVAALGIANTMLMTVLERTREVGVMKAVGAADRHIRRIFLVEGLLIGLVGGVLGVLLSWSSSYPLDSWIRSMVSRQMKVELTESLFVFPLWITLGTIAFASVVTTIAAVYPAHRAARVNPIAALRHE